ncbi:MAG: glutaminyl-peptide cyclotransferase [Gemmatimonadota bacterium]
MPLIVRFLPLLAAVLVAACGNASSKTLDAPFEVIAQYPHDTGAYTQGLIWQDSVLYESTGRYGHSEVRRVDLRTGAILRTTRLSDDRFGEGLALLGGRLYQLTWESKVAYVYDAATLALVDSIPYAGEGWGLATDGTSLFMSDGSDSIRVVAPATLATDRVIHVRYEDSPLSKLNELEFIDGELYANVYESDWVARLDPATGGVRQLIDFAALWPRGQRPYGTEVMNGIARAPSPGDLLLTGKLWPTMFSVRLTAKR